MTVPTDTAFKMTLANACQPTATLAAAADVACGQCGTAGTWRYAVGPDWFRCTCGNVCEGERMIVARYRLAAARASDEPQNATVGAS